MSIAAELALDWSYAASGDWRSFNLTEKPANAKGIVALYARDGSNNAGHKMRFGSVPASLMSWPTDEGNSRIGLMLLEDLRYMSSNTLQQYNAWSHVYVAAWWITADSDIELKATYASNDTPTHTFTPDYDGIAIVAATEASGGVALTGVDSTDVGPNSWSGDGFAGGVKALTSGQEVTLGGNGGSTSVIYTFQEVTRNIEFVRALYERYASTSTTINEDIGAPPEGAQFLVSFGAVSGNKYNVPNNPSYGGVGHSVIIDTGSSAPRVRMYLWDAEDLAARSDTNFYQVTNQYSNNAIAAYWVVSPNEITYDGGAVHGNKGALSLDLSGEKGRVIFAYDADDTNWYAVYRGSGLGPAVGADQGMMASRTHGTGPIDYSAYNIKAWAGMAFSADAVSAAGGGGKRLSQVAIIS